MYIFFRYAHAHVCLSLFSCAQLFATLWTVAHQSPLSMRFYRQEYWSGLPCSRLGYLPDPRIELRLLRCKQILYHWATGEVSKYTPKYLVFKLFYLYIIKNLLSCVNFYFLFVNIHINIKNKNYHIDSRFKCI